MSHSVGPHADARLEIKQHFVEQIAAKLEKAWARKAFRHLILAASPEILGQLKKKLTPEVLHCVIAIVPKDLTHETGKNLELHLEKILGGLMA